MYLIASGQGKTQADKICQELKCGDCYRGCDEKDGLFKGQTSEESVSLKCDGKEQFSWQCMYELSNCMEQVGVICKSKCKATIVKQLSGVCRSD